MILPRARGLLLDLDGTLLDTAQDMVGALNALLAEEDRPAIAFDSARPQVSHGAKALVRLGFGEDDPVDFERRRLRFLALYEQNVCVHTCLFDGYAQLFEQLQKAQIPWGIVTNKPTHLTLPLVRAFAFDKQTHCVVCGDTFPERKPHPRPMLHAAQLLGLPPQAILYVGDAKRDIDAGRAAGMRTVVASFGYFGADENPQHWAADGIIHHALDLRAWLDLPQ